MKNEFVLAFNEVLEEKQLSREVVLDALEAAMVSAYRRAVNASNAQHVEAKIDTETGKIRIFAEKEIVESVQDARTEVSLSNAIKEDADARIGGIAVVETTPGNFGRVAAQTARQVIQQKIREAERAGQLDYFSKQLGEIVSGVIHAINFQFVTLGLDKKAEGIMPRGQQLPGERFRVHDRVRALLLEVKPTARGTQIILSRAHRNFLRRLLENEVPEIYQGMVEIRSIAREPGRRSKVAVAALQAGVDPVGACVGIRGVRIQAIVRELNDEKIDVIEWNPDPAAYIAKALSPARVNGVYLNEYAKRTKTATVVVPEDQLSLAIGRDGQNARLSAKLTSWRIDIKSLPEAATDALYKLQNDPEYAAMAQSEAEAMPLVELVLTKKAEGRPIPPEEYKTLNRFVDRIEQSVILQRQEKKRIEEERLTIAQANVPTVAYDMLLDDLGISLRFSTIISGAGYSTVGDLMLQMNLDSDVILALNGVGPKAMAEIEEALANVTFPEPKEEAPPVVEAEVDAEVMLTDESEAAVPIVEAQEEVVESVVEVVIEAADTEKVKEAETLEQVVEAEAIEPSTPEEDAATSEEIQAIPATEKPELVEEEMLSKFDELFELRPEVLDMAEPLDDEDEMEEDDSRKKKKEKRKKFIEMEYLPDQDVVIVKKKRKRGDTDWEDKWDY